mgnify:CR=1 FL=1
MEGTPIPSLPLDLPAGVLVGEHVPGGSGLPVQPGRAAEALGQSTQSAGNVRWNVPELRSVLEETRPVQSPVQDAAVQRVTDAGRAPVVLWILGPAGAEMHGG